MTTEDSVKNGVNGSTMGYILGASLSACTQSTIDKTLADIKKMDSGVSVGWLGVVSCWPSQSKSASSKKSFYEENKSYILIGSGVGGGCLLLVCAVAAYVYFRPRNLPDPAETIATSKLRQQRTMLVLR